MSDTATDFNGLPDGGASQDADVLAIQRGTGTDSTKRVTLAAIVTRALARLLAGSGIKVSLASGNLTFESGGADIVEISTTTATLDLTHVNRSIKCNNASAQTLTIAPQSSVTWPANIQLEGWQHGAGAVTFAPGSGVTIHKSSKITLTTDGQYSAWGLKRIAENEWLLFGGMGSA